MANSSLKVAADWRDHHMAAPKYFKMKSFLKHICIWLWHRQMGQWGRWKKSISSSLDCSQKTIHQAPPDPAACMSALSANRLNPILNSTHTSILTLLLLCPMTKWFVLGTQSCNPSVGEKLGDKLKLAAASSLAGTPIIQNVPNDSVLEIDVL